MSNKTVTIKVVHNPKDPNDKKGMVIGPTVQKKAIGERAPLGVVAIPIYGYCFMKWSDGVKGASRYFIECNEDTEVYPIFRRLTT